MIYLDWLLLIVDYFRTLTKRVFLFEWGGPVLFACWLYFENIGNSKNGELMISIANGTISLLGVLIAFSIAVVTLLTTINGSSINQIKATSTKIYIGGKELTLYDLLLINYTYSIVIEVLLVMCNFILLNLQHCITKDVHLSNVLNAINVFMIFHVLLLTLRNIVSFYFILFKDNG